VILDEQGSYDKNYSRNFISLNFEFLLFRSYDVTWDGSKGESFGEQEGERIR
jgi:hypothetical protein